MLPYLLRPRRVPRPALMLLTASAALMCRPAPPQHGMDAARSASAQAVPLDTVPAATDLPARPIVPGDRSNFTVAIGNARLLVIDARGARTGLDPASGKKVQEIPESAVFVDRIDDAVTGEPATSFTVQVIVNQPTEGPYRITVVGLGQPSELVVHAFATDGSAQPQIGLALRLEEGSRTELRLHFLKAPGSSSRLQKIEPGGPQ